jgi:ribosomal protein S12 methylthiotransferase
VAQVPAIVRQALARRAEKIRPDETATPGKSASRSSAKRITADLARLDQQRPPARVAPPSAPLLEVHARPTYIPAYATPRFQLTPRHFAYVKIAEGCNHPCSFCVIPRMRGSHRSRPLADIVREAQTLLANGVKELNLISQDSTYYGLDLRANHSRTIASPPV